MGASDDFINVPTSVLVLVSSCGSGRARTSIKPRAVVSSRQAVLTLLLLADQSPDTPGTGACARHPEGAAGCRFRPFVLLFLHPRRGWATRAGAGQAPVFIR